MLTSLYATRALSGTDQAVARYGGIGASEESSPVVLTRFHLFENHTGLTPGFGFIRPPLERCEDTVVVGGCLTSN